MWGATWSGSVVSEERCKEIGIQLGAVHFTKEVTFRDGSTIVRPAEPTASCLQKVYFLLKQTDLDHSGWSKERHQQYDCQQLLAEALNLNSFKPASPTKCFQEGSQYQYICILKVGQKKKLYFSLATWRKLSVDCNLFVLPVDQIVPSIWNCSPTADLPDHIERYSRKVFVGGLPPDIDEGKKA